MFQGRALSVLGVIQDIVSLNCYSGVPERVRGRSYTVAFIE